MFHIEISRDGKTVESVDTNAVIACINQQDADGIRVDSFLDCNALTVFEMLLSLDPIKERLLKSDPTIAFLYSIKDCLLDGTTTIDISAIKKQVEGK